LGDYHFNLIPMRSPGAAVGGILGPSVLADGRLIVLLAGGSHFIFKK
jgi:hypothetical protein